MCDECGECIGDTMASKVTDRLQEFADMSKTEKWSVLVNILQTTCEFL